MHLSVSGYNIEFGDAGEALNGFLKNKNYSTITILVDENTEQHCLPRILKFLPDHKVVRIPSGEENKNIETSQHIWSGLLNHNADRHSLMINLGGGVIGDMGGFVASTYMRGIDFIQVPTTLLSQVDASVGGKLGIDFKGLKNFVGLFNNPESVIVDAQFIHTLPEAEVRSGFAEMIKHALIRDKDMWKRYQKHTDWKKNLTNAELKKSVDAKRKVVIEDPFEKNIRKILNFGHTLGHAIETYSFQTTQPLLHGYAIALGMIGEAYLSHTMLGLSKAELEEIRKYILSIYEIDTSFYNDIEAIMNNMKHDKKNRSGKVLFSLLQSIGDCTFDVEVSTEKIEESLLYSLKS